MQNQIIYLFNYLYKYFHKDHLIEMNFFRRTLRNFTFSSSRTRTLYNLIPYVLIGGGKFTRLGEEEHSYPIFGTASYYASLTIRARDPNAKVLIIADELDSPYRRGPFAKELWWFGDANSADTLSYENPANGRRRYLCYEAEGFYLSPEELDEYEHGGVALMKSAKVARVDADKNYVELEDGSQIEFGKCLIATGSRPIHQNSTKEMRPYITTLHNADDYRRLYGVIEKLAIDGPQTSNEKSDDENVVVVIGGGLLGTELAYSINRKFVRDREKSPLKIVQLCHESGILAEILPTSLSEYSTELLRAQGVEIYTNASIGATTFVATLNQEDRRKINISLKGTAQGKLDGGRATKEGKRGMDDNSIGIRCDHIVVALGAEPNVNLAEKSGLKLDNKNGGIFADAHFRVRNNVWAAGDVCSFMDEQLGRRRRCTHWQHAQITGRMAGENMTGGNKTYTHQGAFVSMFGPFGHVCGIGDVDPNRLKTTTLLAIDEEKSAEDDEMHAVVLYEDPLKGTLAGVLLYNMLGYGEEMARKLIRDARPLKELNAIEYAKLFEFWEKEGDDLSKNEEIGQQQQQVHELTEDELQAYQGRED